jgi:cathepsin F
VALVSALTEEEEFNKYVVSFSKSYPTPEAYLRAFSNWKESKKRIEQLNEKDKTATYGINKFSDLSPKQFQALYTPQRIPAQALAQSCLANGVTATIELSPDAIPTSFDWRQKGVVTPVKNQGQCGSCWAFSTIGDIESQWAIKGNKLTQFSEQLLVDCSHGCSNEPPYGDVCNQGCGGGWQWNAYFDIESWGGVETEAQYPYTGVDGNCQLNKNMVTAGIKNYTCLSHKKGGANEEDMAAYLVQHGPIAIALDATPLLDYQGGVLNPGPDGCSTTVLDHALLIVGYGVASDSTPFWIIKNSWGADWGESGYFRIIRGQGACGLNNAVSSVVM